MLILSLYP